jgi:hypothetical protein
MDIKEGRLLVHSHWFPRRREGRRENLNQAIVSELRIVENAVGKNARERTRQVLAPKSADIDEGLEVFFGGFMTPSNMPPLTSTHRANGSFGHFRRSGRRPNWSGVTQQSEVRNALFHFRLAEVVLAREQTISVSQKLILCDI